MEPSVVVTLLYSLQVDLGARPGKVMITTSLIYFALRNTPSTTHVSMATACTHTHSYLKEIAFIYFILIIKRHKSYVPF